MTFYSSDRHWLFNRDAGWVGALLWGWVALLGNAGAQDCLNLVNAVELGTNVASVTRNGSVSAAQPGDFYRFTVAGTVREVTARIPANSLSGGIGLSVLRDSDNNGIVDSSDPLFSDSAQAPSFPKDATVTIWLDPGTYFVRVCHSGSDTAYQLNLTQTVRSESAGNGDNTLLSPGIRMLSDTQPLIDFVGILDPADYVKFTVTNPVAEVIVAISGTSLAGLRRFREVAGIGLKLFPWGAQGNEQIFVSASGQGPFGFVYDAITTLWLDRGTYFVKMENPVRADGTEYQLRLTNRAKLFSPGNGDNDCSTARLLLPRSPTNDFVGISDTADYYKVIVSGQPADVRATIPATSLSHPVRLRLLSNCGAGELASSVGNPGAFGSTDAVVAGFLAPGTYFLRVEPENSNDNEDNTTYLLSLSAPEPPLPSIQLSGDLAFGDVPVNTSATRSLTISNSGPTVLNISGITSPAGFSAAFSGALDAGGSTNVTVTFAPIQGTTYGGSLTVNSDAVLGLGTWPVSGRGVTRVINLTGLLAFGDVEVRQRANRTLMIQNTGNTPLTITEISYPDAFSGAYSGSIPAGGSVNVTVTFAPLTNINYGGTVVVSSDKTSGANMISVSGTGTRVLSRIIGLIGNLAFGDVESGQRTNRVLVITNSGEAALTVSSITYPDGFSGNYFGGVIPSHNWRNVLVTFSPLGPVPYGGPVLVNSPDANGGNNTIEASGTGTPQRSRTMNLIGDLNFGSIPARSSATRKLIITNSGAVSFTVSNISYPAGFGGAFNGLVSPGGARTVMVTFAPLLATNYDGLVIVNSPDSNGGTNRIQASGSGTPVALRPAAGTYAGLFRPGENFDNESSGYFTLTATRSGMYTAAIRLGGRQHMGISGHFAFDGAATNQIKRVGKPTVKVVWQASPIDADLIGVTVDAGFRIDALVGEGHRAVYAAITNDAPQAGRRYTLLFTVPLPRTGEPEGIGFGTVSVNKRGMVKFNGRLADGTAMAQQAPISAGGDWPFYGSFYKGGGSVLGWLLFTNYPADDLTGRVSWVRPPDASSKLYPGGFNVECESTGSRYIPPLGKTNRVVAITNGVITLLGGELSEALINPVTLGANNKVTNVGPHKLTMTIKNATGLFSGKVMPMGSTKAILFQGAILQRTNLAGFGAGYHTGSNLNGRILFEARE